MKIVMIIMNMQKKLYTIQFSHFPMTNSQSVPERQSWNLEIMNFTKFLKKKFELLDKKGFKLTKTRKKYSFLPTSQPPFVN